MAWEAGGWSTIWSTSPIGCPPSPASQGQILSRGAPWTASTSLPLLRGETPNETPRRFWQLNTYQPVGWVNAAMREGPWKLVRPNVRVEPASDEDRRVIWSPGFQGALLSGSFSFVSSGNGGTPIASGARHRALLSGTSRRPPLGAVCHSGL